MATLTNKQIRNTYKDLLKINSVSDNTGIDGTLRAVEDGDATASALQISTGGVKSTGTFEVTGASTLTGAVTSGLINGQTISSAANLTGTLAVTGNATFDTNTLFVDAANNNVSIGTSSPYVGTRLTLQESASNPSGLAIRNRNSTQTWQFSVDAAAVDDKILAFIDPGAGQVRMALDASGNLGLGVTPSAWAINPAFQIKDGGSLWALNNQNLWLSQNAYFDGGHKYIASVPASQYAQSSGSHAWYQAPSGTAGNPISFTQAMTLFNTGNLAVGGTSDAGYKLNVTGTAGLSTGTAWTHTSDKRIKQNIVSIVNGLEKINQLNPVEYNYTQEYLDEHKELKDIRYNSFIADEYAEVFPNAVNVGGNLEKVITKAVEEVKNENGEIITEKVDEVKEIIHEKLLNYTPHDLIMYLVASVKELSAKVEALEAK